MRAGSYDSGSCLVLRGRRGRLRGARGAATLVLAAALLVPALLAATPTHADTAGPSADVPAVAGDATTFGYDAYGQLGLGFADNNAHSTPTQVVTAANSIAVADGYYHVLALTSSGGVLAWGANSYGALGVNSTTQTCNGQPCSLTPVAVQGLGGFGHLKNVTAIAAGDNFSLALLNTGHVVAWGYNGYGQLGNGSTDGNTHPTPTVVHVITNAVSLAASGDHALALTKDGRVWAWGYNGYGQTGDGTFGNNTTTPVLVVSLLPKAKAIAAGYYHSMALSTTGKVYAWGYDGNGQLGNGTTNPNNYNYAIPVPVSNLSGVTAIGAGWYHSLAVAAGGSVWGWGDGGNGQLGTGNNTSVNVPAQALGVGGSGTLSGATAVAGGSYHSLVLLSNGSAVAMGDNGYGELGDGNTTGSNVPVAVSNPAGTKASAIAAGYYDSVEVTH